MDSNNDSQPSADMDSNNDSLPSLQQSLAMDSNNDSLPSADMDSNNGSLPSPQQSLEVITLDKCENSDLAQSEAYDIDFLSTLANLLWTEGGEGWPLEPFEIKEEYFIKSLSLAKKVSNEFYLLAETETKILTNKKGDFGDYKVCVANNWVRGEMLCLRKLLEDHFTANISQYKYHRNMFEDLVEVLWMEKSISTESLFSFWTHWKNNIVQGRKSLSSYQTGDPGEHVKFLVNYLGVRKVKNTWFLLFPKLSWMKQEVAHFLTPHGTRLFSISLDGLKAFVTEYWRSELASVGFRVLKILSTFYDIRNDEFPKAHRFSTFLHIWDVVKLLKIVVHSETAHTRLEEYTNRLIEAYLEQISPLGWNAEMNKDIVMLRKSQVCVDIVEHFIYRELRGKNDLSYDQLTNILVMMFGVLKPDNKVYKFFSLKWEDKKPWRAFIESLMRGSDTKEGEELNQFMLFYGAMKNTIPLSSIQRASNISPINLLYLIERLLLWTSLLKDGVIYATKSTMTEWLIHQHNKESIKRLIGQTDLEGVHEYLAKLLLELSRQNSCWTRRHDGRSTLMFVHRIVVAACMLHLSSRNHFGLLEAMLSNSGITCYLHPKFWKVLSDGRTNKHIGVQVVARALRCIENPLVIATLRHGSLDIACLAKAKNEIKLSTNPDSFWDWLDSLVKDPNKVLVDNPIMKSFLKSCIILVTTSLQNPLSLESQDEMRQLENFLDEMKELLHPTSLKFDNLVKLLKSILSRKSKVAHILNQLLLMSQRDAVAEWEAQGSSVAAASSQ